MERSALQIQQRHHNTNYSSVSVDLLQLQPYIHDVTRWKRTPHASESPLCGLAKPFFYGKRYSHDFYRDDLGVAKTIIASTSLFLTRTISGRTQRFETRDVAGAAALLRERGFQVACVMLVFWAAPLCFVRGGAEAFTQALCGAVDVALLLGARLVNCYNVGVPLSLFGDAVAPAAHYAASKGVIITLETRRMTNRVCR